MDIKTEFNIGDTVHFLYNNKALSIIVQGIKTEVWPGSILVTYLCNDQPDKILNLKVLEKEAFKTKELLLESLTPTL